MVVLSSRKDELGTFLNVSIVYIGWKNGTVLTFNIYFVTAHERVDVSVSPDAPFLNLIEIVLLLAEAPVV